MRKRRVRFKKWNKERRKEEKKKNFLRLSISKTGSREILKERDKKKNKKKDRIEKKENGNRLKK